MYSNIKVINKKQIPICKNCLINAINKAREEELSDNDISVSISKTRTLEHEHIEKLHKLNTIIEESNLVT